MSRNSWMWKHDGLWFILSSFSGSGSQDIRNIIPFGGKGFLLGGNSQNSTSSTAHKAEVPLSSCVSSPKKFFTPASPAKTLSPPAHNCLSEKTSGLPSVRPSTSSGEKPPVKRSVGNTRAFVNINGSPVKVSKVQSVSGGQRAEKVKQKSIQDLFSKANLRKSESQSSISDTQSKIDILASSNSASFNFTKQQTNHLTSSPKYSPVLSATSQGSPTKPAQSKYFTDSGSVVAAGRDQVSRKRMRDGLSSSASIFDFFQKTLSDSARGESVKAKSHATQQRTAATTASSSTSTSLQSSAGLHSAASPSSSSSVLMVSCPACQVKVQESKINEHLDSCLSWRIFKGFKPISKQENAQFYRLILLDKTILTVMLKTEWSRTWIDKHG